MATLSSRPAQDVEALKEELDVMASFAMLLGSVINVCARAEMMTENGAPTHELQAMHVELGMTLSAVVNMHTIDPSYLIVLLEANINRVEEMLP